MLRRALFRPVRNNRTGNLEKPITGDGIYKMVKRYALDAGVHRALVLPVGKELAEGHPESIWGGF